MLSSGRTMCSNRLLGLITVLTLAVAAAPVSGQDVESEATPGELTVVDMAFGSGYDYDTRVLVETGDTFPAGTEVIWCRTRVTGADGPATVTHVWYREGKTMARVELRIASSNFRTVSSKKLLPEWTGRWEVKVLDEDGTVLRAESFTVE